MLLYFDSFLSDPYRGLNSSDWRRCWMVRAAAKPFPAVASFQRRLMGRRHGLREIDSALINDAPLRYTLMRLVSRWALARGNEKLKANSQQERFGLLHRRLQPSGSVPGKRFRFKGKLRSGPRFSDSPLYRKSRGQGAQLCYQSHILMENRNGLIVDHELTLASGTGERTAAVDMVTRLPGNHRVTVGADRGYDSADFIDDLRCRNATPHVAQNTKNRRSAIDARTTRHPGYITSQRIRKRIEETFGWGKMVGPLRQVKVRGVARVNHLCPLT